VQPGTEAATPARSPRVGDRHRAAAEWEQRWELSLRLAIKAASEAEAQAITSHLDGIEPDDAENRCRYVSHHFGPYVTWISRDSQREARWDWPPDIWNRQPGTDDVLLHPAVQAVMIWCRPREPEQAHLGHHPG
jgi:hypothetical protein